MAMISSTLWVQAARRLARDRGFTLTSVATLGAGIGLTTALFSVVYGVLLAPLGYPGAERIVSLQTAWQDTGKRTPRLSGGDLADVRREMRSYQALSRVVGGESGVQLGDHAEFTGVYYVDPGFYTVFSTPPAAGHAPAAHQAAVSAGFARRNFGGERAALGRTLNVEKKAYEITAVMPDGFAYPNRKSHVWVSFPPEMERSSRTAYNYRTVAKLVPGVSINQATSELQALGARLAAAYPAENKNKSFVAVSLHDYLTGTVRTMLWVLMGAVGLVLLIACANVANLMLARSTARARELSLRVALGASPARIVRLLWSEGLLIAAASAALGWVLAWAGTGALLRLAPENLPRLDEVTVDARAFAFACLVAMAASVIFSLAPAWQALRTDVNETLKQGGGRGLAGGYAQRLRGALVVAEIALAFVLALGAGLLGRSFATLLDAELGYRPDGVLVMYAHLPAGTEDEYVRAGSTFEQLTARLRALPGVKNAAVVMGLPGGLYHSNGLYAVAGKHTFTPGARLPEAGFRLSGPGYFQAMGAPLLRGRDFTVADQFASEPVAIVSAALARQTFAGEDPIGRRIKCGLDRDVWMRVVGVVGDMRNDSPAEPAAPELYMPVTQHPFMANELQVVVRSYGDPALLTEAVRQTVRGLNPDIATSFTTLRATLDATISAPRFRTYLAGVFAMLALIFAMAGIHGVMSYAVERRRAEFGVRVALGARTPDLARLILGSALRWAVTGTLIGAVLSLAAVRVLASLLVGVQISDARAILLALAAVAASTLAAVAVPIARAAHVDPMTALRQE